MKRHRLNSSCSSACYSCFYSMLLQSFLVVLLHNQIHMVRVFFLVDLCWSNSMLCQPFLVIALHNQNHILMTWFSGYKFVHAVAIQLINRMYSTIPEPALRPAVCNTPCSLSCSVLRQGILISCALTSLRLDDFSDIVTYILY